jgi:hypothetical protein
VKKVREILKKEIALAKNLWFEIITILRIVLSHTTNSKACRHNYTKCFSKSETLCSYVPVGCKL